MGKKVKVKLSGGRDQDEVVGKAETSREIFVANLLIGQRMSSYKYFQIWI